jgi:uncharacterized iron-regulated protein
MRFPFLIASIAVFAGCAGHGEPTASHPLAGRIWDVSAQRFIDAQEAERRVAGADYALLGETHDSRAHHQIQRMLLDRVTAQGRTPALVMEQIDTDRQSSVDAVRNTADAAAIARAGGVAPGWNWPLYEPVVALALERRLAIVAGNLSRERARQVGRNGIASLGASEVERLALESSWNAARNALLRHSMVEGHCGHEPPGADAMVAGQRARDAVLADRILASGEAGAVVILGRGHARADVGVPLYLAQRAPGKRVVSLGLVEVAKGHNTPGEYPDAARGVHDLVWFTPRTSRHDPCEGFTAPVSAAPAS